MTSKFRKNELEQQLDVEVFRDSILTYFAGVSNQTYFFHHPCCCKKIKLSSSANGSKLIFFNDQINFEKQGY